MNDHWQIGECLGEGHCDCVRFVMLLVQKLGITASDRMVLVWVINCKKNAVMYFNIFYVCILMSKDSFIVSLEINSTRKIV